jgi:hypothetical protein
VSRTALQISRELLDADSASRNRLYNELYACPIDEVITAGFVLHDETGRESAMHQVASACQKHGATAWPALAQAAKSGNEGLELLVGTIAYCKGVSEQDRLEAFRDLAASPHKGVLYALLDEIEDPTEVFQRKQ